MKDQDFNISEKVFNLFIDHWIKKNRKLFQKLLREGYKYTKDLLYYLDNVPLIDLDEYNTIYPLANFFYSALILSLSTLVKMRDICKRYPISVDLAVPKNNTDKTIVAASFCVLQFHRELAETKVDLADIIIMLSMRPTEVVTLHIIHYKPGEAKNNLESWQFLSMKKNPEHAKELLIWIQVAIATRKLCNLIYSINRKHSTEVFSKILKSYNITAKRLRKIRNKHVFRVYDSQNSTSHHLEFLSRVAIRHKINHHNSEIYYAESNTSDSDLDLDPEPESEVLAPTFKAINENTSEITY
ncbi:13263_t:CDS:2 [Cetraspora pellucida]|uniref:13263_t:CDS:1 n=1 Tax=Cetraspora pellucida TaxID=1433469 RepID=A0A9N9B4U4_9GLOM|nr:13263_t:CDS:2 [Cetraspora pellucida]